MVSSEHSTDHSKVLSTSSYCLHKGEYKIKSQQLIDTTQEAAARSVVSLHRFPLPAVPAARYLHTRRPTTCCQLTCILTHTRRIGIIGVPKVAREGKRTRTVGPGRLTAQAAVTLLRESCFQLSGCRNNDSLSPPPCLCYDGALAPQNSGAEQRRHFWPAS